MLLGAIDAVALSAAVAIGYVLGSIPVAVLIARGQGFDPRDVGDRNPGYWNVKEQRGGQAALPVFVGDVCKGALAAGAGIVLDGSTWGIAYAAVAAAMIGHAFPVFADFRGGRSVLTFVGGMAVLSPVAAAAAAAAFAIVWAGSRSLALAARVGVFGFPLVQIGFESKERVAATGALMGIVGLRFAQAAVRDRQA
ncbi:MAG: glycerol-3-phosphate acyltransferase [Acidimicrobiales bacterium]|nr:glycerol-3-phosphate acyltransferase [Acidimicrobiales bacterium]